MMEKTYIITCKACKRESHIPAENEEIAGTIWGQLHSQEDVKCPQTREFMDKIFNKLLEMRTKHAPDKEIAEMLKNAEKELIRRFLIVKVEE